MENSDEKPPFPLEGGRAGDGGDAWRGSNLKGPAPGAIARARRLRKEMTVAERALWKELRKFALHIRWQVPIGPFIADFAHHGSRLIIEVDGYFHSLPENADRDVRRTDWLRSKGYRVIRFNEKEVLKDPSQIAARVEAEILSPPSLTLPPSRGKGR
jgi:very-short-patch-repair endonuclease